MDIGSNIQLHRKRLGLSQEELGQKLLVSRQTISLWEKGQTTPTIDNLLRLKEIFDISLDCLFGEEVPVQPPESPTENYSLSLSQKDLKEISRIISRPALHGAIIRSIIIIVLLLFSIIGTLGSLHFLWSLYALCLIAGFWIQFLRTKKTTLRSMMHLADRQRTYLLFSDYFESITYLDGEQVGHSKHYYRDIVKIQQCKHFMLLQLKEGIIIFPIDAFYDDSRFHRYAQDNPSKKAPGPNIVLWRTVSIILLITCFISILLAGFLVPTLGEAGLLIPTDMWIFFLFTPIPVASIVFGFIAKTKGYRSPKNIIAGFIIAAVLCGFGCFTFIFAEIYTDDPIGVERVEYYMDIDIPEYDRIVTNNIGSGSDATDPSYTWYTSDVYFSEYESRDFEALFAQDERFLRSMPSELTGLTGLIVHLGSYDRVLLYNVDTGQYNTYPEESGVYRMIAVGYSIKNKHLYIAEYNLDYTAS